jgi:hypothetical protein
MASFTRYASGFSLTIVILLLLGSTPAFAQEESPHEPLEIATIVHPPLDEPVAPLDTLILIKIDDYYVGPDFFYLIMLDDKAISARWDPDALSFSYYPDRMLTTGEHTIKVFMTQTGGPQHQPVAQGTFTVGGGGLPAGPAPPTTLFDLGAPRRPPRPPSPVVGGLPSEFFRLTGRASVDASFVELDGLGSRLRQEPDNTSIFDLNGRGRSQETDFDFRFYLTTDESKYEQPRNRYSFHVAQADHGFTIGDTTPRLGSLTIDGLRLRGAYGWGTVEPFTLHFVEGQARRETESTYDENGRPIRRGVGEQRMWAARAGLWEGNPFSLGFTYLTGEEEPGDIADYGNPGENTVRSIDFLWELAGGDGAVRGAWAEADYNYDDPDTEDVSGAQAREAEIAWVLGGHSLKAHWQRVDPGFTSLGRLSLQKDRETWGFEDRLNFMRGALTGRLFWEQYHNNISDTLDYTTESSMYGGQLRYRLNRMGPTFMVGLNTQDRSNDAPEGERARIDESVNTLSLGLMQTFNFWDGRHDLRVDWRTVERDSRADDMNDSTQDVITVTLTSRWVKGFQFNLLYGNTDNDYPGRERFTEVDRYSARLSYTHPDRTFTLWSGWEGVSSEGNQATYDSERETLEFGMKWMLGSDLSLETSLKLVDFDDQADDANDFQEHTFRIMLVQMLS